MLLFFLIFLAILSFSYADVFVSRFSSEYAIKNDCKTFEDCLCKCFTYKAYVQDIKLFLEDEITGKYCSKACVYGIEEVLGKNPKIDEKRVFNIYRTCRRAGRYWEKFLKFLVKLYEREGSSTFVKVFCYQLKGKKCSLSSPGYVIYELIGYTHKKERFEKYVRQKGLPEALTVGVINLVSFFHFWSCQLENEGFLKSVPEFERSACKDFDNFSVLHAKSGYPIWPYKLKPQIPEEFFGR